MVDWLQRIFGKRERVNKDTIAPNDVAAEIESQVAEEVLVCNHEKDEGEDFCIDCLSLMAIRCAWCEGVIAIGDPITLYEPTASYKVPDYAVRYAGNPNLLVGCSAWECAWSAADIMGVWAADSSSGKGCVERHPSLLELLMASGADAVSGGPEGVKFHYKE